MKEVKVKSVTELVELIDKVMQDKPNEVTEKEEISLADYFIPGEKFFNKVMKTNQKQSDRFITELNKIHGSHECPVLHAQLDMLAEQADVFHSLVVDQARALYKAYEVILKDHKG